MTKGMLKPVPALAFIVTLGWFASSCACAIGAFQVHGETILGICVPGGMFFVGGSGSGFSAIPAEQLSLNPQEWSCEDTENSPPWADSLLSEVPYFEILGFEQPRKTQSSGSTVAYLPQQYLDLPFPAQPSSSFTLPGCDASQPDMFQVNHDNAAVNRVSTCPLGPKATIAVATRPLQIAMTPDGSTALVTSFDNAVNFIDLKSNQVIYTLHTDSSINPDGIAIAPDGAHAYITSFNDFNPAVEVIDLASRQITASIPLIEYPQNVFISPDGANLLVTHPFDNQVDLIDTFTNTVTITFPISDPRGVDFESKGTKAYIASADSGVVQELDMNTFQTGTKYTVGTGPSDVKVMYGDRYIVVNDYEGQAVSVIDTLTAKVQNLPVSGPPTGMAVLR